MTRPPADRTVQDAGAHRDGKITRDMVLTTALEIIDREGADGLSMRRLARALDRDPMILHRYAPNKAALLDGVAETVLAQLKVDPADPDWACTGCRSANSPASQPRPRPGRLRRHGRARTRPRHPPYRTGHHAAPARRGAILQPGWLIAG